jgi:hypothetical protein
VLADLCLQSAVLIELRLVEFLQLDRAWVPAISEAHAAAHSFFWADAILHQIGRNVLEGVKTVTFPDTSIQLRPAAEAIAVEG